MGVRKWAGCAATISMMTLCAASIAQAQVVTFSRITDAVPSKFFDSARSGPSTLNANRLTIGLNSGFDSRVMKWSDFRASTATYRYRTAMDSISFDIQAPTGFYIAKITYTQRGTGSVTGTGKASGASTWSVAGVSKDLGTFGTSPILSRTVDLTGKYLKLVPVTIATSLFAYATTSLGSATVTITSADVLVQLLPLP